LRHHKKHILPAVTTRHHTYNREHKDGPPRSYWRTKSLDGSILAVCRQMHIEALPTLTPKTPGPSLGTNTSHRALQCHAFLLQTARTAHPAQTQAIAPLVHRIHTHRRLISTRRRRWYLESHGAGILNHMTLISFINSYALSHSRSPSPSRPTRKARHLHMSFGLKSRVRFPTAMNPCVGDIRHVLGSNHICFFNVVIKSGPCERGKCMVVAMGEDEVRGRARGR
jgi:hypothetical protein